LPHCLPVPPFDRVVFEGNYSLGRWVCAAPNCINTERLFETHKFGDLLPAVKRIFKEAGWLGTGASGVRFGTLAEIEKLILAFDQIDPKSYTFRYPIDRNGNANLPEHFHFNVVALGEEAHEMLKMLDGAVRGATRCFRRLLVSSTTLLEKRGNYPMASAFLHASQP
jgi:hypothetical protein